MISGSKDDTTLNVRWTFGSAGRSEAETKAMQLDASIHCRPFDPDITLILRSKDNTVYGGSG